MKQLIQSKLKKKNKTGTIIKSFLAGKECASLFINVRGLRARLSYSKAESLSDDAFEDAKSQLSSAYLVYKRWLIAKNK